jgi:hypothetical protein
MASFFHPPLCLSFDSFFAFLLCFSPLFKRVVERLPLLNNKPALMRAYKRTISKEGGGDGDDWVEKKEFKQLLINLFYFNRLWKAFDGIDTGKQPEQKSNFKS